MGLFHLNFGALGTVLVIRVCYLIEKQSETKEHVYFSS